MSIIKDNFVKLAREKELPMEYLEIEGGHHLFRLQFGVTDVLVVAVEIIIQNTDAPYADGQIVYRNIHMVDSYSKRAKALETINDLNEMKTGYYSLYLAGDGEIFLRNLMRVSADPQCLYETLVYGSAIARDAIKALNEALGEVKKG